MALHLTHEKLTLGIDFESHSIYGIAQLYLIKKGKENLDDHINLHLQQAVVQQVTVNGFTVTFDHANYQSKEILETKNDTSYSLKDFREEFIENMTQADLGELTIFLHEIKDYQSIEQFVVVVEYELHNPKIGIHFRDKPIPYVFTDPRGYYPKYWYPCCNSLLIHHTFELIFEIPKNFQVISNGKLMEEINEEEEEETIIRYSHIIPTTPSSIGFVCGNFSNFQQSFKRDLSYKKEKMYEENQLNLNMNLNMKMKSNVNMDMNIEKEYENDEEDEDEDEDDENSELNCYGYSLNYNFINNKKKTKKKKINNGDENAKKDENEEKEDNEDEEDINKYWIDDEDNDNDIDEEEEEEEDDDDDIFKLNEETITQKNLIHEMKNTLQTLNAYFKFCEDFLGFRYPYSTFSVIFLPNLPKDTIFSFAGFVILSEKILYSEANIDGVHFRQMKIIFSVTSQFFGQFLHVKNPRDHWILMGLAGHLQYLAFRCLFGNSEYQYLKLNNNEFICHEKIFREVLWNSDPLTFGPINTKYYNIKSVLAIQLLESMVTAEIFRKILNKLLKNAKKKDKDMIIMTNQLITMCRKATGFNFDHFAFQWLYSSKTPKLLCSVSFNKKRQVIELKVSQYKTPVFLGQLKVRVHEFNGIFDYYYKLEEPEQKFDVFVKSRLHKHKGKKIEYENGDTISFKLKQNNPSPVFYVRVDPDLHWIRELIFVKDDQSMWEHELQLERSVIAQYETIQFLSARKHETALKLLISTLNDARLFCKIRIEAAKGLVAQDGPSTDWQAGKVLMNTYADNFFDCITGMIKPNDFSDLKGYEFRKGLTLVISTVQDNTDHTPAKIINFLLDLIRFNDNSYNEFSDDYYLSIVIKSLGNLYPKETEYFEKIFVEIQRFLEKDELMPSHEYIITRSCLKTMRKFQDRTYIEFEFFENLLKNKNYTENVKIQIILSCLFTSPEEEFSERFKHILTLIFSTEFQEEFSNFHLIILIHKLSKHLMKNSKNNNKSYFQIIPLLNKQNQINEEIVYLIWNYMNQGILEITLRSTLFKLYDTLYGINTPRCLKDSFGSNFNKNKSYHYSNKKEFYHNSSKGSSSSSRFSHKIKQSRGNHRDSFYNIKVFNPKKAKKKKYRLEKGFRRKKAIIGDSALSKSFKLVKDSQQNSEKSSLSSNNENMTHDEISNTISIPNLNLAPNGKNNNNNNNNNNLTDKQDLNNVQDSQNKKDNLSINGNNDQMEIINGNGNQIKKLNQLQPQNLLKILPPIKPLQFNMDGMKEMENVENKKNFKKGFFIRKIDEQTIKFIRPKEPKYKFIKGNSILKFSIKKIEY
ncbi:transcription initiation factor tfiid [Anaeramoeba flamelloides]|uniref:Transcription initiation factor TFIID subunit 2 n=1 Tax=Anaeramoeba flamelloides TaxID=1746091 RepID=A0ABQ8YBN9_9EUKA|nr:transcription initiation factor tfiid [Anaeramoeba flamelloides]